MLLQLQELIQRSSNNKISSNNQLNTRIWTVLLDPHLIQAMLLNMNVRYDDHSVREVLKTGHKIHETLYELFKLDIYIRVYTL